MTLLSDRVTKGVTFIAGSEKNAGKTALLNLLLGSARALGRAAYLSIGVDGESRDLVFGNPKPRIYARENDLVATSQKALAEASAEYRVLEVYPGRTVFGKTALAEVTREGYIELTRPGDNADVAGIIQSLTEDFGAASVLVDGASDRVTQAACVPGAGYVFVLRARQTGLEKAAARARQLCAFDSVAVAHVLPEGAVELEGALTPAAAAAVPPGSAVRLEDFTRVFLNPREFAAFAASRRVFFRRKSELRFICVILQDAGRVDFLRLFDCPAAEKHLVFNPYEDGNG